MFNLLYKELSLAAHPNLYVFTLFGVFVLIPSYPYGVMFLFGCLGPYITFLYGRETNDIYYTALLPVKKRDVVKSKCLLLVVAQIAQLLISLPFAFLRVPLLPGGNPVGIEANVAFYGFGLIVYALFNLIFLPVFFKTAYKVGKAFILAVIPASLGIAVMEVLVHLPGLNWLDSIEPAVMMRQLPILISGIVLYGLGILAAYHISARRFAAVDL